MTYIIKYNRIPVLGREPLYTEADTAPLNPEVGDRFLHTPTGDSFVWNGTLWMGESPIFYTVLQDGASQNRLNMVTFPTTTHDILVRNLSGVLFMSSSVNLTDLNYWEVEIRSANFAKNYVRLPGGLYSGQNRTQNTFHPFSMTFDVVLDTTTVWGVRNQLIKRGSPAPCNCTYTVRLHKVYR